MLRYTLEQLSAAETYANDPALATLARRVAVNHTATDLSVGDRKRLALSGGLAAAVLAAVNELCDAEDARLNADRANRAAFDALGLPGWSIVVAGEYAELSGPMDQGVNASLRRHGEWDADRRVWRVPVGKGQTLARSLRRQLGPATQQAREDRMEAARRAHLERWLGYVESAAIDGRVYKRGVDELAQHGIYGVPDLADRLNRALHKAGAVAAQRAEAREAARAEQQAEWETQRAERRRAPAPRMLWPLDTAPVLGQPYRLGDRVVVYTGAGQQFDINADHASIWGSHLLGHEGEPCAYFYYRDADADERAELEATEARQRAERDAANARAAELRSLCAMVQQTGQFAPTGSTLPIDPTVIHDTRDAHGGGHALLIGDDETLWYVRANGADGDDWSANNVPGGMAWYSADAGLVARARALAGSVNGAEA